MRLAEEESGQLAQESQDANQKRYDRAVKKRGTLVWDSRQGTYRKRRRKDTTVGIEGIEELAGHQDDRDDQGDPGDENDSKSEPEYPGLKNPPQPEPVVDSPEE